MKKYDELIKAYKADADAIKSLDVERKAAAAKLNEFWEKVGETYADTWDVDEERNLSATWQAADEAYNTAMMTLRQNIEDEYAAVPFSAPRKAGIEHVMDGLGF